MVTALYRYLWRRLVRDTTTRWGRPRRLGTALFVAGPVLMFAALFTEVGHAPFALQRTLAWPGFLWMVLSLYLLPAVVAGEGVRPQLRRALKRPVRGAGLYSICGYRRVGAPSHDDEQLLSRTGGPHQGRGELREELPPTRTEDPTPAPSRRGFAQRVVDTINATQPDLIAVVGDLVDGSVQDLGPAAAPLAQLSAGHGSFFVTGNRA